MADKEFESAFNSSTGKYDTVLSKDEEKKFDEWRRNNPKNFQSTEGYDLKGYFKENGAVDLTAKGQHLPDKYKKPDHITFSKDSKYHSEETPGGEWSKDDKGKWRFAPSEHNINMHGKDGLKSYFKNSEKEAVLDLKD